MSAIRSEAPAFSINDAVEAAKRFYGLSECVRQLPSERDQNFLFEGKDGLFTLKIANRDEKREVLDFQNRAIERTGCLKVIPATQGQEIVEFQGHLVRLVTYIPGVPLGEFAPHSPELLSNFGRALGNVDKALASFSHAADGRDLYWDIRNAQRVIESYKHLIRDEGRRSLVERILGRWVVAVVPEVERLRVSVIHSDANDYNVIVRSEQSVGLIDFGDMVKSFTVAEPAIACAYVMLHKPDPIAAAAEVVRGYHEVYPLTPVEISHLYDFIRVRLAMSVTIAAHQKELEPDNAYLLISEKPAWALLEKLDSVHPRLVHYIFREVCGLPACPEAAAVVSYLGGADCARVVDGDLTGPAAIVLDLSIGSLDVGTIDEVEDVGRFTKILFRRMEDAGATVGVGRYNEPRGLYTSPLFSSESNDGPEWRTIHLGIDLFMLAESPVYTPLDGVVHSVKNNDQSLDYGPTIIVRHATADGVTFYTLYGHLSIDSLQMVKPGQQVRRGEQIAKIGTYPTNGGWAPHLHFQVICDMLERDGEFPGVAAPSRREVWLSLSPDANLVLKIPASKFPADPPSREETLQSRLEAIGPSLSISYKSPLKIVRGSGAYLYDDVGRGYLDCVNNVAHVGHAHPKVVRAAQRQMAVLNTNTRYLHDNIIGYARRLTAKLPQELSVCFFVNSGSEANDLALRLARAHTRAKDMVVMETAYHGNLSSLIEISPYKFDGPGGAGAASHVHKLAMADGFRVKRTAAEYADEVRSAVGGRPTIFFMESLLSCAGQVVLPEGYLKAAYGIVREAGGVCVADEVQVGFGRVGSHFWGFETQGVVPDIVTMGKSIGNGHPLGAVVTTREIASSFNNGMEYFNTYGGNPVSCAVGAAVMDVIEEEGLQERALRVGQRLRAGLEGLMERHPLVGDVRGLGLFLGIELVRDCGTLEPAPEEASYVVERMKRRGVLLSTDGPFHNVIKIKPPMSFSADGAEMLVAGLDVVLRERK